MAAAFNIEARWPELFAPLSEANRTAVLNSFASSWHEGWVPNREDVENLTDYARGAIDKDEYDRRAAGAAKHHRSCAEGEALPARYSGSAEANFNIEARWPELFASLNEVDRDAVVNAFASSWHEGWVPNREDVENLTDFVRGAIDEPEYDRRAAGAAERHRAHAAATSDPQSRHA